MYIVEWDDHERLIRKGMEERDSDLFYDIIPPLACMK